jgi:hypothetical protein
MRKHHEVREGQIVRVIDGPLTGFRGEVKEVDEQTAKVAVRVFGRVTPMDGRDLSDEGIAFQNVSHGKTFPEILSDNAEPIAAFMAGYVRNPTFQEPSAVELSYVRFTPKRGHVQCN